MEMPQRNPTKFADVSQQPPAAGIYYEFNRQRPAKPYMLRWTEAGSKKSQSFATEKERQEVADKLGRLREVHGTEILNFDPREWRRWLAFKEAAGDVDPMQILHEWRAGRTTAGLVAGSLATTEAVERYVAYRSEGSLSKDTQRHINKHVRERFAGYFGGERLDSITPEAISEWLASLKSSKGANKGESVENLTKRHHRKDVNTFFDFCVRKGWLTRNPVELVPVPAVEEEDVELLTPEECRRLFEANAGHRIAGRLALEAFGFLRASSAGRIQREHINFEERGIRMPGAEHKSKKAKFRQGHPDVLWAWLNRAPDECWSMTWWEYRNEKRDAFVRAGVGGSDNRLRKTCLSAHLAWLKNQPLTSYLAQHRHQSTTDIYLGVMTEKAGEEWFRIGPL